MGAVTIDYGNMLSPRLRGRGVDPSDLDGELTHAFREALGELEVRRASGELGFFALADATEEARSIQALADSFGQWFENVVVLGIGGSALGTIVLRDALLGPHWNEGDAEAREHYPRLFVLDNVDPRTVRSLLDRIDIRRTLFNVVSKSGSTAETMAQYLVVAGRLREALGDEPTRGHFLFTTDPHQGALRALAEREGIPSLEIPPNVGGRFSVLSAVGLLPAAVVGIDIQGLLEGARTMARRAMIADLRRNPAGILAVLLHRAHTRLGAHVHVLMPYCDRLRSFAAWFQQLWAESLGKAVDRTGATVHVGPTPLPALGATDQHSLLQLFMEGPRDKVVMFMEVKETPDPVPIPPLHPDVPGLSYLGGRSLSELLAVEMRATMEALRQVGRPNLLVEVEALTPQAMGELFMLFQAATVLAGALYGVDPLNQPGVELSKRLTYGLLGRAGYDKPPSADADQTWRV